ncbi:MAG: tRNA lysidine(34) synthetase TilS [Pseudomonadales bacterium]|nr:tRNA lysidine(34) synthetase TilS [Pseudomonadales bacterium]
MDQAALEATAGLRAALRERLGAGHASARLVALSGGRDSLTLLALLCAVHAEAGTPAPRALHVHHGLDPAADRWAEAVAEQGARLGADTEILRVRVESAGEGLEAAARRARYEAFAGRLRRGEQLLLAQHRDDQLETVFLRLLRGAGPRGLAGMPRSRPLGAGMLLRPWLDRSGAEIEQAARALGLRWIEDPANGAPAVDRAFLRGQLLPQLRARWPGAEAGILRAAEACAETESALAALLPEVPAAGAPLTLARLGAGTERRRAVLRAWFASAGLPMPPRARLEELLRQLAAGPDAVIAVRFGAVEVRRHAGRLHLVARERPAPSGARIALVPGAHHLGCGLLELHAAVGDARALRADLAHCEVRFRDAGERLRLPGRGGTTLKRLLQESGVPPWERDRVPLLCAGDEVLAVAGVAVCEAGRAAPGAPGLVLRWTPDRCVGEGPGADREGVVEAPSVGSQDALR